jgi:hypothetical protein
MNEPKKRGRPAKVRVDLTAEAMSGITGDEFERPPFVSEPSVFTQRQAQAYANRVWAGQSADVKHEERIARVQRALAGQNLPFEGVVLP